jgi:hypothetical protein
MHGPMNVKKAVKCIDFAWRFLFYFAVKCLATISSLVDATTCVPRGLTLKAVFFPLSVGACSAWFAQ